MPNRGLSLKLLALLAILAGAGCASVAPAPPSQVLLMGEVHDNPDGHRQRYEALRALVEAGWRPAIAMEQFDRERQPALTAAQASCHDADCIIAQAGNGKGWSWEHYRAPIELALRYKLELLAANVSRADASKVIKDGFSAALDAPTIAAFGLDQPLPAGLMERQQSEIAASHCGQLPDAMLPGMARAQVTRDIWMAKTVREHASGGVVLLAGNGHVRRDIGAGRWLSGLAPVSHGFVEAGNAPQAGTYDVVHSIPVHVRPDPCAAFVAPKKPAP
ncbi:MAG: ChaN family lipoprotein [Pseudomonadota bacterium]